MTIYIFENLTEHSFYSIKTTYTYDLNDGRGLQTDSSVIKYLYYDTSDKKIALSADVVANFCIYKAV